jgi:hypothetical protein
MIDFIIKSFGYIKIEYIYISYAHVLLLIDLKNVPGISALHDRNSDVATIQNESRSSMITAVVFHRN